MGFGEVRAGGPDKTKTGGFDSNQPGPSGFRLADARFVELLDRWNPIALRSSPAGSPRQTRNRMMQFDRTLLSLIRP
jgi:hypothetical protein